MLGVLFVPGRDPGPPQDRLPADYWCDWALARLIGPVPNLLEFWIVAPYFPPYYCTVTKEEMHQAQFAPR